jgi:hypothetical protein
MRILLDDKPLTVEDVSPDASLAQLLDVAKGRLQGTGSVIVALRHNDEDVPVERLEQMLREPVSNLDNLELVTGRPTEVVLTALEEVRVAFAETFAEVKEAAEALTTGNLGAASRTLADCVGVWARTHEAIVQGGALVGVNFDEIEIGGRTMVDRLLVLVAKLRELKEAVESRDHVLLGDILRYEMDEVLQQWEQMLNGFIDHLRQLDEVAGCHPTVA